jgi:hypothetical protein
MTDRSARELLVRIEATWHPLRDAVTRLGAKGLEKKTPVGWTAKEMLAHLAFWTEASFAVITSTVRGQELKAGWSFASGYVPEEPWPRADVHNAREAAWARSRSPTQVVARLDAAYAQLTAIVATLTEQEIDAHSEYWQELDGRYRDHLPELEALLPGPEGQAR